MSVSTRLRRAAAVCGAAVTVPLALAASASSPASAAPAPFGTPQATAVLDGWLKGLTTTIDSGNLSGVAGYVTGPFASYVKLGITPQQVAAAASKKVVPVVLSGTKVVVPCQSGTPSVFVAEAASVKTFGQFFGSDVAVVFERSGKTWRADQAVIWSGPGGLPALCSGPAEASNGAALVAPAALPDVAAKVFTAAASGTEHGAKAAAPFAAAGIDQGADSVTAAFAGARAAMEHHHDDLSVTFTTTTTPPLPLPLAAGGDWVFVTLHQATTSTSKAGVAAKGDWPDGESVATPSPAVVHRQVDTYETVYALSDPLRGPGALIPGNADGFLGWSLSSVAS